MHAYCTWFVAKVRGQGAEKLRQTHCHGHARRAYVRRCVRVVSPREATAATKAAKKPKTTGATGLGTRPAGTSARAQASSNGLGTTQRRTSPEASRQAGNPTARP